MFPDMQFYINLEFPIMTVPVAFPVHLVTLHKI